MFKVVKWLYGLGKKSEKSVASTLKVIVSCETHIGLVYAFSILSIHFNLCTHIRDSFMLFEMDSNFLLFSNQICNEKKTHRENLITV